MLDKNSVEAIESILEKDKTAIVKPTKDGIKIFIEELKLIKTNNKPKH